ncbi:MAG: insulinase family protein [Candidatus Delongbacteria bacterium]|nr:insulinase family protein [Candidatus Delongbacteria bacterium]
MGKLEQGGIYHNFLLERSEFKREINAELMSFVHTGTGTKLTAVKNDDDNKTFCISFKTIPEDSTGVAHILEHSVLSGSEKYPVKDVFAELMKGGLSTFMNAFTSTDATYYPFSTRNEKEYFNFMSVYLDTTLRPLLKKHTFMQEGWHYELNGRDEPLEYQGIVYNEMKGAMSNPLRQMSVYISETLLPGSTYSFNSGGDPDEITDLTYEKFLDFHKKYYHPTNAHIYLYGNSDIKKELEFIDKNYLSGYERSEPKIIIRSGSRIEPMKEKDYYYPLNSSEPSERKTYIALSTIIGRPEDIELNLAMHLISNIIFNSDASPLKQAVMKSGIAGDFSGYFDDSQLETYVTSYISGSEPENKDRFIDIYFEILNKMVSEGIDKELILSEINHLEFKQKEKEISSMRGLIYLNRILHLIQYDIDIFENININHVISNIRKKATETDFLEKIIEKYLMRREVTAVVTMIPDAGLSDKKLIRENEKLREHKNTLSEVQTEELIGETARFKAEQEAENKEEDIAKVPKLRVTDIKTKIILTNPDLIDLNGTYLYSNEYFTNDIVYLSIGFDLSSVPVELLPYLTLFTDLFREAGTKKRPYDVLYKEISMYFGGFDFALTMLDNVKDPMKFTPILYFEIKTLKKYIFKAGEILKDLISNMDYSNFERVKEVIISRHQQREVGLKSEGYDYSVTRLKACVSERGRFLEMVKGLTSYYTTKKVYDNIDSELENAVSKLEQLSRHIFNSNNLHFGVVSDSHGIKAAKELCSEIINLLPDDPVPDILIKKYPDFTINEAFLTSSEVVFVSMGGNYPVTGAEYNGSFEVVKNYLSSDYLFENIRLKGGAYGAWMYFNQFSGFLSMTSYRDPNVAKTLEVYKKIPENLSRFRMNEDSFTSIKIGAYAAFDPLLSPYARGKKSREDYMTGIDQDYVEKIVCGILNTTRKDVVLSAEYFREYLRNSTISAIGNAEKIRKDREIFSKLSEIN